MPRKREKTYLIDFAEDRVVGYTYSRDNARRWVTITPEFTARDSVSSSKTNGKIPYIGKLSTIKVLQYLFTDGYQTSPEGYTMDDLQMLVAGASDISIITALSDMKNDLYSGGKPVLTKKVGGRYVRQ